MDEYKIPIKLQLANVTVQERFYNLIDNSYLWWVQHDYLFMLQDGYDIYEKNRLGSSILTVWNFSSILNENYMTNILESYSNSGVLPTISAFFSHMGYHALYPNLLKTFKFSFFWPLGLQFHSNGSSMSVQSYLHIFLLLCLYFVSSGGCCHPCSAQWGSLVSNCQSGPLYLHACRYIIKSFDFGSL